MRKSFVALVAGGIGLLLAACGGNTTVTAKVLDCRMTKPTEEVQRKDGWNPPAGYDCNNSVCLKPGEYELTYIVNNAETAQRIVTIDGTGPIEVPPGDSVSTGPRTLGFECPAPGDFLDVELLSE